MTIKPVNEVRRDRANTDELRNIYTEDIACVLCWLAFPDENAGEIENEVEKALYNIKCIAENPYNNDYYRILIQVLANIAGLQNYN